MAFEIINLLTYLTYYLLFLDIAITLTAAWKYGLLERRVADCSDDWSQDITGTLDKPSWHKKDLVYTT